MNKRCKPEDHDIYFIGPKNMYECTKSRGEVAGDTLRNLENMRAQTTLPELMSS